MSRDCGKHFTVTAKEINNRNVIRLYFFMSLFFKFYFFNLQKTFLKYIIINFDTKFELILPVNKD